MSDSVVNLSNRASIATLDEENMLGSIESLGLQLEHAWADTRDIFFTPTSEITNVVVAGMGGSGLGADVIKHLFVNQLTLPFDYVHSYSLPAYVNEHTLVILSSYSGTTEEVLACGQDALDKGAQIMAITSGGTLANLAREHGWPVYVIDPKFNPSNQPRMAIGYSVVGIMGLVERAGLLPISASEIKELSVTIADQVAKCTVEVPESDNLAKKLAFLQVDKQAILIASEFLEGAIHVSTNQANENGKTMTIYAVVPELNHHLMEGLANPLQEKDHTVALLVQSGLYAHKNQVRMDLTNQIFTKAGFETFEIKLSAQSKQAQVWELITILAFANFYLAMLYGINPSPIPMVEHFKELLAKR